MICTPEEARKKECPAMRKKCDADGCMAWVLHLIPMPTDNYAWRGRIPPPPPELMLDGKGYCGMLRRT